jgi:hypothetical protein
MKKYILVMMIMMAGAFTTRAQYNLQNELYKIMRVFDTVPHISFDVRYVYHTDTIAGRFDHEEMEGSFTLNGQKAWYRMGPVAFMQNDSLAITVHDEEKFILVGKAKSGTANSGQKAPLRQTIDSLVANSTSHYTITIRDEDDSTRTIRFLRADSMAQYDEFVIVYDQLGYYLRKVQYFFKEYEYFDDDLMLGRPATLRRKSLEATYSKYRLDRVNPELYRHDQYVFFDGSGFRPVSKFSDYEVYGN